MQNSLQNLTGEVIRLFALLIPIARAEFTIAPLLQVPPASRGEPRLGSVPPASRGNLKEGVLVYPYFCELWLSDWYNTPNNRISGASDTEQPTDLRAGSYSLIRGGANNRISADGESEPNADPHAGSYSLIRGGANNRITADADTPSPFANLAPFQSCIPADLLQAWLPQGLAPADLDAVQVMLAYAEAKGFPALVVDGYTIHGDLAGWLTAAAQLADTPAIARATRLLHVLDTVGTPTAPTHDTTLRNGDAGCVPSQLSLLEG